MYQNKLDFTRPLKQGLIKHSISFKHRKWLKLTFIELDKEIARAAAEKLEFASIISGDTLDPEIIKEAII